MKKEGPMIKRIIKRLRWVVLAGSVSILIACSSGGDSNPEPGRSLTDVFTDAQIASMESVGLQINAGANPPNIEGTFRINLRIIQASSMPNSADPIGSTVVSQNLTFTNQDNAMRTIELTAEADGFPASAFGEIVVLGSFISGSGNAFTAFTRTEVTFDDQTFETAQAVSGVITDNGIENIQQLGLVIDDGGDPGDFLNPNGTAQLFIDEDGVSERL